jgi:hypothetical protein
MWPYALATLRHAWRAPFTWGLAAGSVFVGWFAGAAAILALYDVDDAATPLTLSTGHLAGVLLTLWLVGRGLDEDRHSGFAVAADATKPGAAGRLLGRWAGAATAGAALAALVAHLTAAVSTLEPPPLFSLLSTTIQTTTLVGAWALLLGTGWKGGGTTLLAFLLWVLGHLPWGRDPLLEGAAGRVLRALLPGPREAAVAGSGLGYTSAAAAGLLLLALAFSRPSDT